MDIIYVDKVVIKKKYYYDDKCRIAIVFDVEDIKNNVIGWIFICNNYYSFSPRQSPNYYVFSLDALQTLTNFMDKLNGKM